MFTYLRYQNNLPNMNQNGNNVMKLDTSRIAQQFNKPMLKVGISV